MSSQVYLYYLYFHVLMEVDYFVGVGYASVGQLAYMYQSVLMHSHVDKGSKGRNVGNYPRKHHALLKVLDAGDVLVELKHFEARARV